MKRTLTAVVVAAIASIALGVAPAAHADTVAPETTITGGPGPATKFSEATFSFASNEPGSTFWCHLDTDDLWIECSSPYTVRPLGEGGHTFGVVAVDPSGNEDPTPAFYHWTIDSAAPDTFLTANPPSPDTAGEAEFRFDSTEAGSTFWCTLDTNLPQPCFSPWLVNVGPGDHLAYVYAVDRAFNADPTPAIWRWTVVPAGPETTITSGPAEGVYTGPSVTFEFASDAAGATFECRLDSAPTFGPCSGPGGKHVVSGLAAGPHSFSVRASAGGRTDGSPATRSFVVDATAPVAKVGKLNPFQTKGTTFNVAWNASDKGGSGVARYAVRYRAITSTATAWTTVSWLDTTLTKSSLAGTAGSTYCFSVRATDGAGNVGGWSAEKCTAVPVDDRALAATGTWTPLSASAYYLKTASRSAAGGSRLTLSNVRAKQLAVVVTTCPACGELRVLWNGTEVLRTSLVSTGTVNKVVVLVPAFASIQSGSVAVVATSAAAVDVDAVGLSAA